MPYVDGRPDWVRFTRAYVNNSECCPSRATILSGQYSHHTGVETTPRGRTSTNRDDDRDLARPHLPHGVLRQVPKQVADGWRSRPPRSRRVGTTGRASSEQAGLLQLHAQPERDARTTSAPVLERLFDRRAHEEGDRLPADDHRAVPGRRFAHTGPQARSRRRRDTWGLRSTFRSRMTANFNESNAGKPAWWQARPPRGPGSHGRVNPPANGIALSRGRGRSTGFSGIGTADMLEQTYVIYISDNASRAALTAGTERLRLRGVPPRPAVDLGALRDPARSGRWSAMSTWRRPSPSWRGSTPTFPSRTGRPRPVLKGTASRPRQALLSGVCPGDPVNKPPGCWGIRGSAGSTSRRWGPA